MIRNQRTSALIIAALLVSASASAQTRVELRRNSFTPAQDVQLGQRAAADARRQLPMLNDGPTDAVVERIGRRLVSAVPARFRHSGFRYSFDVVNLREINAFALPGGPMFLNRGMLQAARTDDEVAGVMAHELAHVVLRHGTLQASKAQKFQFGALAGQIIGSIVGGNKGQIIAQGSQIGLGTYFLKYGREYQREADILGAQIMSRAGYDPRHMANMFRTIAQQGGGRGPEWLSSHPDPGNRYNAINREASMLRVAGAANTGASFTSVRSRLSQMPPCTFGAATRPQTLRQGCYSGAQGCSTLPAPPPHSSAPLRTLSHPLRTLSHPPSYTYADSLILRGWPCVSFDCSQPRSICLLAPLGSPISARVDPADTRLLTQPAISASHIAFIYAGDLFVADSKGTNVQRLTTDDGLESNPVFSPDGKTIAFSAQYDGNTDVYTVPVTGGAPVRLTWHPGADSVQSFTPDGKAILFTSQRATFTGRYAQLFTVPAAGGMEEQLPIPNAARATYSPDGQRIAYNPIPPRFAQWKQYRGGTVSRLWLYSSKGHGIEKVPQPADRSNDTDPMWIGDTVFFRSDRNGEFNIFAYDTKGKQVRQVTTHDDFPVLNASTGAGKIVYEQAGVLHVLDPKTGKADRLTIGVASDLRETRARFAKGTRWIRAAALSPTGTRAAFDFRGEIVTVPGRERGRPQSHQQCDRARSLSGMVTGWTLDRLVLGRVRRVSALYR